MDGRQRSGAAAAVRIASIILAIGSVVGSLVWMDRGSLERGNRLYRDGQRAAAVELYGGLGGSDDGLREYNLGTGLLSVDPDSANRILVDVADGGDGQASQRANYNLGARALFASEVAAEPDSIVLLLQEAVRRGRAALRLDPGHTDARWNLALAQTRLDERLDQPGDGDRRSAEVDDDEFVVDDPSLVRSENADGESGQEPEDTRETEAIGQRSGAQFGAREAWATQDPGPLSNIDALELMELTEDVPELLIRGILWAHRPDIAWWENETYPGGGW